MVLRGGYSTPSPSKIFPPKSWRRFFCARRSRELGGSMKSLKRTEQVALFFFSSSGKRSRRGNVESTLKSYATCKLIGYFGFVWKIGDRNSNVMKPHCFPVWWQFLGIEAYPVPVLGGVSQLVSGQQPYYNPVRYRITQWYIYVCMYVCM